jgi:hypothetical protein
MEVMFTQLAARSPCAVKNWSLMHRANLQSGSATQWKFTNYNTFYHFLLKFEMSTFVKDMYIKYNCSNNRQLLAGKMPSKRRLADCIQYPAAG